MTPLITTRNDLGFDWTGADFDSLLVLTELGITRPAARVNRARRGRPLRRAVRVALRTALTATGPISLRAAGRRFAR
ncbi:hypothetical protein [Streptomyces sp. NPDC001930]|uniref:hypothetical protein n=1 Tax=Streptomyces sp. NPDC001930 TaxID=3364625 RepID=UPI0036C778A7